MKIAYELWSTGLINQVISLEVAVGISELYQIPILLHNIKQDGIYSPTKWFVQNSRRKSFITAQIEKPVLNLLDLLEWDNQGWEFITENISDKLLNYETVSTIGSYIDCSKKCESQLIYQNELLLEYDKNYNFINTIIFYNNFFKNRSLLIDIALSKIKWKSPYVELSKMISQQLGAFSSMHLRMTDHRNTFAVTEEGFVEGLRYLSSKGYPIILSTDDPDTSFVVANKSKFVLIDDLIMENWSESFKSLPFCDEVVFGLICNLIMGSSTHFIGTPGSTYSGYIHRCCNSRIDNFEWNFFSGILGPNYNTSVFLTNPPPWWREYPESKLRI